MKTDKDKIKEILQILQEGYNKRDAKYIDTFMKIYSPKDNSLIIGTGLGGVFRGFEEAKELFLGDWESWGDVKYDTPNIQIKGDMAYVFMFGKVNTTDLRITLILEKEKERWFIHHMHFSHPRNT